MNFMDYQIQAHRTECDTEAAHTRLAVTGITQIKLLHATIGMMGELGELASNIEHHFYYGQGFDKVNFEEELGDVLWYVAEACSALGIPMETIASMNIKKLRKRYPDKYTDDLAREENRNRQQERQVLEQNGQGFAEPLEDE